MKLRVFLAVLACKAVRLLARILHRGGTAKPGEIALKICPTLLTYVSRDVDTILVTGTNGKTTTCRMLEQAFAEAGKPCIVNRSGANLMSGITTEFVMQCSLTGKCRKRYAVMECDEGWTKRVLPAMHPRALVVTNLFRDQVDRYGDVSNTLAAIADGAKGSPGTTLVLNADDHIVAALARLAPNPVAWYGLDIPAPGAQPAPGAGEVTECMVCGQQMEFDYVNYAHHGAFHCPGCGHARPDTDVGVTEIDRLDLDGSAVKLRVNRETRNIYVNLPALYNISNAAGAVAGAVTMGLPVEAAAAAVENFRAGFGRMEKFDVGAGARMVLVKNAAGADQVLRFLETQTDPFRVVFITNNRSADGTDISWLADAEFERLAALDTVTDVTLSGICADQMHARLLEAGVPGDKLSLQPDYAALAALVAESAQPVFLLPSYTGMMEFRPWLVKLTGGKEFWE